MDLPTKQALQEQADLTNMRLTCAEIRFQAAVATIDSLPAEHRDRLHVKYAADLAQARVDLQEIRDTLACINSVLKQFPDE